MRPNLYFEKSESKLFSLNTKFIHWFNSKLSVRTEFTFGSRRYFFDNDILVFFNQYEKQHLVASFGIDYSLIDEITIFGGFLHTKFQNFRVNYFTLGLKTNYTF